MFFGSTFRVTSAGLLSAAALTLAGCGGAPEAPVAKADGAAMAPAAKQSKPRKQQRSRRPRLKGSALAALDKLAVKGRAPKTGYDREQFGAGWARLDGCDTRERILARDLRRRTGTSCRIQSGLLADPYTATSIRFVRGGASEVDIDHVVALGDVWQKGAQKWAFAKRVRFANDPLNLLAVDASSNRQKGDGDAATWLPPNKSFRCAYVARQIAVKRRYRAWVTRAEHDVMQRVLTGCSRTPLPAGERVRVRVAEHVVRPVETPRPAPTAAPRSSGRVFANCDAVRAAGRAPLLRGDPAYAANPRLDRDKDGVACE
jgi:Protein of unknown function (DUF1524)/Excalibur calcium-binding domain